MCWDRWLDQNSWFSLLRIVDCISCNKWTDFADSSGLYLSEEMNSICWQLQIVFVARRLSQFLTGACGGAGAGVGRGDQTLIFDLKIALLFWSKDITCPISDQTNQNCMFNCSCSFYSLQVNQGTRNIVQTALSCCGWSKSLSSSSLPPLSLFSSVPITITHHPGH